VSDTQLKAIVEALIYASPDPLTPKALAKVLEGETPEAIEDAVAALRADYADGRGLQLVEVAGGYQIVTRPELHEWVRRLFHERATQKLSVQALETLAVIAYKQPVTAAEIAEIRGVNTSGVIGTLISRKLVKIAGRKQVVGRPFMYATTREFLERFGLRDLNDLPRIEDMADVLGFDLTGLETSAANAVLPFDRGEGSDGDVAGEGAGEDVTAHDEDGDAGASEVEAAAEGEPDAAAGEADAADAGSERVH
jgi:segregation and condensation protein B